MKKIAKATTTPMAPVTAMRLSFWRKAGTVLLLAASVTGWYGAYAGYSLGFDAGSKDLNQTAQTASFQKGFDAGKMQAARDSGPQIQQAVDMQVRAKVQDAQDDLNRQMQQRMMQAFQQGAAAQAKAMADRAVGFSVGMPKPASLMKKQ